MKFYIVAALLPLLVSTPLLQAAPASGHQIQNAQHPGEVLREGINKLVNFLTQQKQSDARNMETFIENEIAPYFDFAYMTQWTTRSRRNQMDGKQKAEIERQMKHMFLGSVMKHLSGYQHGWVKFLRPRGNPNTGEVTLGIQAFQQGRYPIRMDFRMYRGPKGWKVFDVVANGQSALVYYRRYFARQQHSAYRHGSRR